MNHRLGPDSTGVGQLVSHTATALTKSATSCDGRAVEIALVVDRDAFGRLSPVGASGEAVEHGVSPAAWRRCHLKDCARAESTAVHRRSVEIARAIDNQIGIDVLTIIVSSKVV